MCSPVWRTCDAAADAISKESWVSLEKKTLLWSGLEKFGDVHATVDWGKSSIGQCVHDTCRFNLSSATKLEQVTVKDRKKREVNECQVQSSSVSRVPSPAAPPAAKRLLYTLGVIHYKTKYVWCCKTEKAKHPESKLKLISYDHAWASFKSHTVALDDQVMRDRINCLIESAGDQPYALEIRYHHKCWLKHVRTDQKMSDDDKLPLMNNVSLRESRTIFFDHIRAIIFEEHELRSLQSLLRDYSSIVSRYNDIIAELHDNDNDFPKQNSEYIDIDELLKTKYKCENCKYACLHLNICSLPSKLAKLEITLYRNIALCFT